MWRKHVWFICSVALLATCAGQAMAAGPEPLVYYPFDQLDGIVLDASGNGLDGAPNGGVQLVPGGYANGCYSFNGSDSYVQLERPVQDSFTLAAWIKTTTASGEIVSWGTPDFGKMWTLGFIRGRVGVTPHGGYLYMNAETHDDRWHHVAVVVRQAEAPNLYDDVTLYLDGQVAVIHDIGLLDLWPIDTGNELDVRIGRNFKGLIDDLRIYSRVLSEDEIHALFTLDTNRPLTQSR